MKKIFLFFVCVSLIAAIFLITACNGGIAAIFGGGTGQWVVSADIAFDSGWTATSPGETNVQISEDLEDITGIATLTIPHGDVSQRMVKGFTKLILNSGTSMLMKKIFPKLQNENFVARNGNVATATQWDENVILEFEVHFAGLDVATPLLNYSYKGGACEQHDVIITRNRNNEDPNEVIFNVEYPYMNVEYDITCTR
jgi:hypothetical protein